MVAFFWAVATFPSPRDLFADVGHGYQLAGATEVLAGRQPFIDFKDTYGPFTYYASASALWLTGGRLIGELALVCSAYALSYACLFRLMVACAVPRGLAFAMSLIAIAVQPTPFRYYLILLPLLFLTAAWRYAHQPTRPRLVWLALTVTVAGLFRPDSGVFTYAAGIVLIATLGGGRSTAWRRVAVFTGMVWLFALPWLVWLAAHGKLTDYFTLSSLHAVQEAVGRAKPAPDFDFSAGIFLGQNAKAWVFRVPGLVLLFAGAMLVIRRRELHGAQQAQLWCAFAYAVPSQLQASHIVDWIHVRDTLPVRFLLLAWIAAGSWPTASAAGVQRLRGAVAWGSAAFICASLFVAAILHEKRWERFYPKVIARKIVACNRRPAELLVALRAQGVDSYRAQVYEYVRAHSEPDEAVFGVLEMPQLNFFTNRRLGGGQMAIFPGYFSTREDQLELIARLRRERTAFVVVDSYDLEGYPGVSLGTFAPEFYAFLQEDFIEVKRFWHCRVLMPKWRTVKPDLRDGKGT